RRGVRALLGRSAAVVALLSGARTSLRRHYGVPDGKLHVIPKGVPAARFPLVDGALRSSARARLGIGDGRVVAYIGALSPEKNVGDAVRAIVDIPDTTLVVAGTGPDRDALVRLASELAPDRIRFLGS